MWAKLLPLPKIKEVHFAQKYWVMQRFHLVLIRIFSDPIHILAFEITNVYTIDRLCGHPLCQQKFHTYMSIRELSSDRATRNLFKLHTYIHT